MIKNYDILVVGGGPAGATAARFLAEKKYKVLLIQILRMKEFIMLCAQQSMPLKQ
jgi:choline dehydrogenase-like flavoprotein